MRSLTADMLPVSPIMWTLLMASPIVQAESCLREDNVDYHGSDITGHPKPIVTGPAACNNLCVQNIACTHWSFGKDNKECYLKNSDSGKNKHNNRISGPQCSTGPCPELDNPGNVLLQFQWRNQAELAKMSEDDKRNILIVEISKHSTIEVPDLQGRLNVGPRHGSLVDIGSMIVTLKQNGWRTKEGLEKMSYDDMRNTLIVELNTRDGTTIRELQGKSDAELVKDACNKK